MMIQIIVITACESLLLHFCDNHCHDQFNGLRYPVISDRHTRKCAQNISDFLQKR